MADFPRQNMGSQPWASWSAAAAAGMAVVFISTGITHFVEPQRSGLEAIMPDFMPNPALLVTLSGLAEFLLAIGLTIPRTRRWAALASVIFLIAVFPANVIAADGVSHPAAPTTPLLPRTLLQLVFVTFAAASLFSKAPQRTRQTTAGRPAGADDLRDGVTTRTTPKRCP